MKDAKTLYQDHHIAYRGLDNSDHLSPDDGLQLRELHRLLGPIHETSLREPSQAGSHGATGSLYEALSPYDYVLTKFEAAMDAFTYMPANHSKACVSLRWKKLVCFYVMTDKSPAYVVAVFLHLHGRRRRFERKWSEQPHWRRQGNNTIKKRYDEAKRRYGSSVTPEKMTPRREIRTLSNTTASTATSSLTSWQFFRKSRQLLEA